MVDDGCFVLSFHVVAERHLLSWHRRRSGISQKAGSIKPMFFLKYLLPNDAAQPCPILSISTPSIEDSWFKKLPIASTARRVFL